VCKANVVIDSAIDIESSLMVDSLSPRLAAIADQVSVSTVLADVGTDHAQLPAWLLTHGHISKAIALDIAEGPLVRARRLGLSFGDRMDVRRSDGLAAVKPGEVDCVTIAGMGGLSVAKILRQGVQVWMAAKQVVIQPQGMEAEARVVLLAGGWGCVEGHLVQDRRKLYVIERWEPSLHEPPWTASDLRWGRLIRANPDPLLGAWLQGELDDVEQGLHRLVDSGHAGHPDAAKLKAQQRLLRMELEGLA